MCACFQELQCPSWFSLWKNPLSLPLESSRQVPTKNGGKILSPRMPLVLLRILYLAGYNCLLPRDFGTGSDKAMQFTLNLEVVIYCQFWLPPFVFWERGNHLKFRNVRARCIISASPHLSLRLTHIHTHLYIHDTHIHTPLYTYTHAIVKLRNMSLYGHIMISFLWVSPGCRLLITKHYFYFGGKHKA